METEQKIEKRWNTPRMAVDAIAEIRGQGIPLIKRRHAPYEDCWALPGGMVEAFGTLKENAARELAEETHLIVSEPEHMRYLGYYDDPDRDERGRVVSHVFYIELEEGKPFADDDAKEVAIFPIDALPPLAFDHQKILDDYLVKKQREEAGSHAH